MKSEGQQTDFIEQQRLAKAYREAGIAAAYDPHFTQEEREARAAYYLLEACKLEGLM
jgi:hypothetical protein